MTEAFSPDERAALAPYVTNMDSGVFALRNLPEEVVAVLFAYYSRSKDSLRRNLLKLLAEGDLVHVTSKRGSIVVPVSASQEVGLSQAFIAMNWGGEYLGGRSSTGERLAGVNALTTSAFCPSSKQPELKHAAVKVLKAELPWSMLAVAWLPDTEALAVREQLRKIMDLFPFASCVPFSNSVPLADARERSRTGVLFRAAGHDAAAANVLARIEALLGLDRPEVVRYADPSRGQRRAMRLSRNGVDAHLEAFLLAGDISAQAWIRTLLLDELPSQAYGRLLLAPGGKAPAAVQSRGKQVCSCLNVSDVEIASCLAGLAGDAQARLSALQADLRCGTSCGSCLPELKRMVGSLPTTVQALELSA